MVEPLDYSHTLEGGSLYEDTSFIYKITDLTPQGWFVPPEIVKVGSTPAGLTLN